MLAVFSVTAATSSSLAAASASALPLTPLIERAACSSVTAEDTADAASASPSF
jgi:hypothetical protein